MTAAGRLSAALAVSLGVHGALCALVSIGAPQEAATSQEATERIEVEVEGAPVRSKRAVAAMGPGPSSTAVALAPVARGKLHAPKQMEPRLPFLESSALVPAGKGEIPVASAPPGSNDGPEVPSTEPIGGAGDRVSEGSAPSAGPDIGVFVERLRRSAQRCSLRRGAPGAEAALARVRFCVDAHGVPQEVSLLQSTGDPRLDRDALDCVVPGAAPLPSSDRCLVVPLRFSL
jgi:TonB family protein